MECTLYELRTVNELIKSSSTNTAQSTTLALAVPEAFFVTSSALNHWIHRIKALDIERLD
jgi:hypothetical protein